MVQSTNIISISTTTTLSGINDVYLVNGGTTGFFVTLPLITTDGMNYRLIRDDISANVITIVPTSPNVIFQNLGVSGTTGSGLTGNYNLLPLTRVELQSYQSNWYVSESVSTLRTAAKTLFTSAFVNNNGNPFLGFSLGGNAFQKVCAFAYDGTIGEQITRMAAVVEKGAGATVLGNISIANSDRSIIYSTLNFDLSSITGTTVVSSNIITNNPITVTTIFFYIQLRSGSSNSAVINLYSLTIQ